MVPVRSKENHHLVAAAGLHRSVSGLGHQQDSNLYGRVVVMVTLSRITNMEQCVLLGGHPANCGQDLLRHQSRHNLQTLHGAWDSLGHQLKVCPAY